MVFVIDAVTFVVVIVIVAIGLYVIEVVVVVRFGFCCSIKNVNNGREVRRGKMTRLRRGKIEADAKLVGCPRNAELKS